MHSATNTAKRTVTVRAKQPPERVDTPKEALEAFERMHQYAELARTARARGHRSGAFTKTAEDAHRKAEEYLDLSERWGTVLRDWLTRQAPGQQR